MNINIDTLRIGLDSLISTKIDVNDSIQKLSEVDSISRISEDQTEIFLGMPISIARIVIPIVIFIIGLLTNWIIRKYERKRELLSYNTTVTIWINNILLPISEQLKKINDLTIQLSKYNVENEFSTYPLLADKLNEIDLNRYIESFVLNTKGNYEKKSKKVFNMISSLKFIEQAEGLIDKLYERYVEGAIIYKNEVIKFITYTKHTFPKESSFIEINSVSYDILNYEKIIENLITAGLVTNGDMNSMRANILVWKNHNDKYKVAFEELANKINKAQTELEDCNKFFNTNKLNYLLLLK